MPSFPFLLRGFAAAACDYKMPALDPTTTYREHHPEAERGPFIFPSARTAFPETLPPTALPSCLIDWNCIPCPLLIYQWKRNCIIMIGLRLIKIHFQRNESERRERASTEVDGHLSFLYKPEWCEQGNEGGMAIGLSTSFFFCHRLLIMLAVSLFPSKHLPRKHIVFNFSSNPIGD